MANNQNGGPSKNSNGEPEQPGNDEARSAGFWASIPGILKAVAAVLGAITALVGALAGAGIIGGDDEPSSTTSSIAVEKTTTTVPSPTSLPTSTSSPPTTSPPPTTSTTTTTEAPLTVTLPDLAGLAESDALETLSELGLGLGTVYEELSDTDAGIVMATNPSAAEEVEIGANVDLVIAKAATPAEAYLAALFDVGVEASLLQPERTPRLWSAIALFDASVTQHAADLESAFLGSYENEPPEFEPPEYAPSSFAIGASDLEEDAAMLATALAQFDLPPPAEVAGLHTSVVGRAGAVAASAGTVRDAISAEEKTSWPQARRHDRRAEMIVLLRDLQQMRMDLAQICVILQPTHPDCLPVLGADVGPDPAVAAYLNGLGEIEDRVDRLETRSADLWRDWELAVDTLITGTDLADYLIGFLGDERLWYVLGYPGAQKSEAAALVTLVEHLELPDDSPLAPNLDELVAAGASVRAEVADTVASFLHNRPRHREQALVGLADELQLLRDVVADACNVASSSYAVCSS